MKTAAALILLGTLINVASAQGSPNQATATPKPAIKTVEAVPHVELRGARIRSTELLGASAIEIDLGAAPPIGSSRLVERSEIERAYASANAAPPKKIPATIRVSRKTRRLAASEVGNAVRAALAETKLPRGAKLEGVRASTVEIPADFHHVTVDLPVLPRRAGPITIQAPVTFVGEGDATLFKAIVPVELSLPPEAAFAEITRGATITLVVKRGLIEVSVGAVASTDADVGSVLPVTLKPSGRVVRARAIDKDHAVALEDS